MYRADYTAPPSLNPPYIHSIEVHYINGPLNYELDPNYPVLLKQDVQDAVYLSQYPNAIELQISMNNIMYNIHSGDTIWGICKRYGITQDELLKMNPWLEKRFSKDKTYILIRPGEHILIPEGEIDLDKENPTGYTANIETDSQPQEQDDNNRPSWEKPLPEYEDPNVYWDGKKFTFKSELSDEEIHKMDVREKMRYYTKYLRYYYKKRLLTLAREQEQRDRLEIIRQQEIQRQKEFKEEYWSPEEIREEVEEYLSWVFTQTARTMGYL